ncbi:nuclease-related domain-containing protein [Clostridium manihotivorum]|uniref:NERD nuclease n=1 Tax=Clostridium manihotivorum TaxID=2320868 RepID=A0A3R5QXC3_9CLOT|nr:nuclease-related domain-containing protein [Clostridium manihotivorum]QAA34457.1 NERD nuclease [Clostridium manihotivorum]
MDAIIEFVTKFWYLIILILVAGILDLFMPKIKRMLGEKPVDAYLSSLDEEKYKVINHISFEVKDKTINIDHVVVSNYGIFVIKDNDYKGTIVGDEADESWKQKLPTKREKISNPIRENYKNIQLLKQVTSEFGDLAYVSIIDFTTNARLQVKAESKVVYTINLVSEIKKYNDEIISDVMKENIYKRLIGYSKRKNQ